MTSVVICQVRFSTMRRSELDDVRVTLTTDELGRASRFRFDDDRDRFILRRGILRRLLAQQLGVPPAEVVLHANEHGKPEIGGTQAEHQVRFSQSSSGDLAMYAFARAREVGIDVERIGPRPHDDVSERFFSPLERAILRGKSDDERADAFYGCWTLKEALVKALGEGLSLELDHFDVDPTPGIGSALLATRWEHCGADDWSLVRLSAPSGYAAALAVQNAPDLSGDVLGPLTVSTVSLAKDVPPIESVLLAER